tara:strand:+ start:70 stop:384 length:315 start_codon:yes stop_codon:yes gene_type:complete
MALEKSIKFWVYQNDNQNPKAPTHSFNNFVIREDIVLKAGTEVDIKFWGNSKNQEGKNNPHLEISKPYKPKQQKQNRDQVYGTPDNNQASQHNIDMLDDDLNRW